MNAMTSENTERSATLPEIEDATSGLRSIQRIAHPTDLSVECENAYFHALRLAIATGAYLDLVHVDQEAHAVTNEQFPSPEATLAEWQMPSRQVEVQRIATYGKEPVRPIVAYLDEKMPDLLVLATHRRQGLTRWLRREVAGKITRQRALPTLFVPVGEEGFVSATTGRVSLRRVLIPVDWAPTGQPAVDTALALVETLCAWPVELTLLHVGEKQSDFPAIALPERGDLSVRWTLQDGEVATEIAGRAAELETDLVVMVTDGRHGLLDTLRGSTTEQVLQQLHCPLLVVPNPIPAGMGLPL